MSKAARASRPVRIIAKTPRRIAAAATIAIAVGLLLKTHSTIPLSILLLRAVIVGLSAATAFTFFEVWPRKLPRWFQRWALQVVAVGVFMPVTTFLIYVLFTPRDAPPFWEESARLTGGRIDVDIARIGERCVVRVSDSGVGLHQSANGLGTGLTALRERLQLIFGDAAHLRMTANVPSGVAVEIEMPAQT